MNPDSEEVRAPNMKAITVYPWKFSEVKKTINPNTAINTPKYIYSANRKVIAPFSYTKSTFCIFDAISFIVLFDSSNNEFFSGSFIFSSVFIFITFL